MHKKTIQKKKLYKLRKRIELYCILKILGENIKLEEERETLIPFNLGYSKVVKINKIECTGLSDYCRVATFKHSVTNHSRKSIRRNKCQD